MFSQFPPPKSKFFDRNNPQPYPSVLRTGTHKTVQNAVQVPGSAITVAVRPGTDNVQVCGVRVYKSVMRLVIIGTTGRGSGTETVVLLVVPDISLVLIS